MSTDVMIEAKSLTKRYGNFKALDRVSFEVKRGEVVGFLGPNGAGKSTTMRILTCYLSATSGSVKVHGHDVFDEPLAVREKIGYLPQRANMYSEMRVWDYLKFVADIRKIPSKQFKQRMDGIIDVCGLAGVLGKDIGTLSHGYRQRVGLGQALIHDPAILVLDEPTSDLDPNEKAEVIEYIKEIGRDRTVILSTHNLAEVEEACARAIIISKGRVVADGSIEDVRARSGRVRYHVVVDEQDVLEGADGYRQSADQEPPSASEVQSALSELDSIISVKETPTDETAHAFTMLGTSGSDIRGSIYQLCVARGWLLLESRRDIQRLEDVFKTLTKGDDERARRLGAPEESQESDEDEELDEQLDEDEELAEDEDEATDDADADEEGDDEDEE